MNKKAILLSIFWNIFLISIAFCEGLKVGTFAPFFKVKSGDDKILTLDMIKGKIIVVFYETKDVVEKNRKLKNELNKFYKKQKDAVKKLIVRLPVIDCSRTFMPFRWIWKSKLKKNSKKEKITVYGDWDGKMKSLYKMKDKESNVVIIDRKGRIRYFAYGKIEEQEINKIKELLEDIGDERVW